VSQEIRGRTRIELIERDGRPREGAAAN
jgi:hypothetical protein